MKTSRLHHLQTHYQIIVEKAPGVFSICSDASDHGCQVYHYVWTRVPVEPLNVFSFDQIIVALSWDENLMTSLLAQ
jgi:hypothetical protein